MKTPTFRGGIHPDTFKELSCNKRIERMPVPDILYLPLSMHWNKPCSPVVKPGDRVLMGQIIADSEEAIPVPIHSPVSGKVLRMESHESVAGGKKPMIVIENDHMDSLDPSVVPLENFTALSTEEQLAFIRSKGLVGMGGAAFPTHFKLKSVLGKVDTLIINASECEPYLTCDHRILLERQPMLLTGIIGLMSVLGLKHAILALEENKQDCVAGLQRFMDAAKISSIEIFVLRNKYPQGYEKQLVKVITGREIPSRGLPGDVGCAIMNAQTACALGDAILTGMPLVRRVITVSGDGVKTPRNLEVRMGTPIGACIEACGGYTGDHRVTICGGPMMGFMQYSPEAVCVKATSGIVVLNNVPDRPHYAPTCIRCGKCVGVCPMHLEPIYMNLYASRRDFDMLEKYHLRDCMECGSCAYICPARIPLVENFRIAKGKLPKTPPAPEAGKKGGLFGGKK